MEIGMNSFLPASAVRMLASDKRKTLIGVILAIVLLAVAGYIGASRDRKVEPTADFDYMLDAWTSVEKIEPAEDITRFRQGLASIARGKYEDAVPVVMQLAKDGVVEAQVTLGTLYAQGQGVPKDLNESARWHRKAAAYYRQRAASGDLQAQYQLGLLYLDGVGTDRAESLSWMVKAARQGHREAQFTLAKLHLDSPAPESKEHLKWLEESARNGYAPAQYKLGVYFTEGTGVEKDKARAKYWLTRAAKQGYQHQEQLEQVQLDP
jgi:TPR repeat protein